MSRPDSPLRQVPLLAAAHLRHEWILTLCLVVALAAVIAPLLVLLGLKHGTIRTLRERLVQDPVFREIRPTQTRVFSPQWFEDVAAWPGVGFLTPTILPLSSVVTVVLPPDRKTALFDLIPTAAGDPLILENGGIVPEDGQVVLTAEAARLAGAGPGDDLEVRITRTRGGRGETVTDRLRVAAVLDARAGSLPRVYAPLAFVLDVEAYKEGYAAPARGWPGETPRPYPSFDGALLLLPEPLPPIVRSGLVINTGFGRMVEIGRERVRKLLGRVPPDGFACYELLAPASPVTPSSLRAVEQKLRGYRRVLLPYARDIVVSVGERRFSPVGLSLDEAQAALLGWTATPWPGLSGLSREGGVPPCLWPAAESPAVGETLQVLAPGTAEVSFPVRVAGTTALDRPVLPVELMGVLRTATQRAVTFDPASQTFQMARGGYRGFRLYAKTIDDVPGLYRRLKDQGVEVAAQVEAIERIRILDRGLSHLFWLIAVLGVCGGTGVLVSSLYAAVDRLRRDLGVLRLLGFARGHVFFFPVVQGLILAALGLAAGFVGYAALAEVIDHSFAMDLAPGEAFCILPGSHVPLVCLSTIALAGLASLAAAWRATGIDPAEVIREQ
ncbi:putative ABC transport system permease protein [Desulfacinum infernum DSM 9756]|uniref:Putative ABC transport system permease protein n=1 Tax=Desulfacinum infernum DSM 9756 TaxID=1121391 RepID=A0A1M5ABZ1_9BACT|nr:FtsX-like permease family protein [Desulfacinum infernum]SHF27841.1 putative ABC transport system permease protein [Desulfacinum infernum DSM 9756]